MTSFRKHDFETARKFIDALRISNPEWHTYHKIDPKGDRDWVRSWIFRGQSKADMWSLQAKSCRQDSWQDPVFSGVLRHLQDKKDLNFEGAWQHERQRLRDSGYDYIKIERLQDLVWQGLVEITLVKEFIRFADSMGHSVPGIDNLNSNTKAFVANYVGNIIDNTSNYKTWMHPAIALAQHHGVPTRLLDWTRQPLVAAYFAASGVKENSDDPNLAVYAIHSTLLNDPLREVTFPQHENIYLRAQDGLFVYDNNIDQHYLEYGEYPRIEQTVEYTSGTVDEVLQPKKFTLPITEAGELLRLLWLERMTEAHLMPTLDHVVEALKVKWRLVGKTDIDESTENEMQGLSQT